MMRTFIEDILDKHNVFVNYVHWMPNQSHDSSTVQLYMIAHVLVNNTDPEYVANGFEQSFVQVGRGAPCNYEFHKSTPVANAKVDLVDKMANHSTKVVYYSTTHAIEVMQLLLLACKHTSWRTYYDQVERILENIIVELRQLPA